MARALSIAILGLGLSACPKVELEGRSFACTRDQDCAPELRCDRGAGVCAAAVEAPRDGGTADAEPLDLGVRDAGRVDSGADAGSPWPEGLLFGPLVGLVASPTGDTLHYFANGLLAERPGTLEAHHRTSAVNRSERFDSPRPASSIAGMARGARGAIYTWFDDGTLAVGSERALAETSLGTFLPAPGHQPGELLGVAFDGEDRAYAYWSDGTLSIGEAAALGTSTSALPVQLPPGKPMRRVAEMEMDAAGTKLWVSYHDGAMSYGPPRAPRERVAPGPLAGMAIDWRPNESPRWQTHLLSTNGFVRLLPGLPQDVFHPQSGPWSGDWIGQQTLAEGWATLPAGRSGWDIRALAINDQHHPIAWYAGGRFGSGSGASLSGATLTRYSLDGVQADYVQPDNAELLEVGLGQRQNAGMESEVFIAWFSDGLRTLGPDLADLRPEPQRFVLPVGRDLADIEAIDFARDSNEADAMTCTLFTDGSICVGRTFDLCLFAQLDIRAD